MPVRAVENTSTDTLELDVVNTRQQIYIECSGARPVKAVSNSCSDISIFHWDMLKGANYKLSDPVTIQLVPGEKMLCNTLRTVRRVLRPYCDWMFVAS